MRRCPRRGQPDVTNIDQLRDDIEVLPSDLTTHKGCIDVTENVDDVFYPRRPSVASTTSIARTSGAHPERADEPAHA